MNNPFVISVVWGDKAPLWENWMLKSLKKVHPNAQYSRFIPNISSLRATLDKRVSSPWNSYTKSRIWKTFCSSHNEPRPLWILDVDLLIVKPLNWEPSSSKIIMAAAPGGDIKYLEFLRKANLPIAEETTINAGVMWVNGDFWPLFEKAYDNLVPVMQGSPYPFSECVLNAIWHRLRKEGKAELLPVCYNQIISEHGLYGATIFHLAGAPEHFKAQLMESYYRFIFQGSVE